MTRVSSGGVSQPTLRSGALALAAGASAFWSHGAQAIQVAQPVDLVTQDFNIVLDSSTPVYMQIGTGAPYGDPQYYILGNDIYLNGDAAVVGGIDSPYGAKASDLAPGTVIGPNSTFITSANADGGEYAFIKGTFDPPSGSYTGYIGLQFDIDGPTPDPYGYATIDGGTLVSVTYDADGGPVTIPAPEPASLSLLTVGAAGLAAIRRRRAKKR